MKSLENIFEHLGLSRSNGLFITKENLWQKGTDFPNRVRRLLENKIKPDAFFCFDNKPLILFFLNPKQESGLHKDIWNFNECPIVFIVTNNAVEIFNGFKFLKDKNTLESLGGIERLTDFNYFELVTGKTWEQHSKDLAYENRIDFHLLKNIKAARKVLVNENKLAPKIANALIGKAIFVRYLIDRKVKMKFDSKLRIWSNSEFCSLLSKPSQMQAFFEYLEDERRGFNGELFPLTTDEYKQVKVADVQVLQRLLGGEVISTGQSSLFELYDFSIIPIEFISNVYELFIGQGNQKKEGAYYTPLFLVDYILKETVEKRLNNIAEATCKVLDPACGSGIFLVETLRKIIEKHIDVTGIGVRSDKFKTVIKKLAQENIYGVDKDESAIQVAVFSIYLTLLDYLEPPGIETFQFPLLLNTNFFVSDFFDEDASFNNSLKRIGFDFILGNPPWMRGKGEKHTPLYVTYINKRQKRESNFDGPKIDIGNKEIAQAFILRSGDFATNKTLNALIVTSKVLYNLQSFSFRTYFLNQFFIERVFELAPVRREVFDKSNDSSIAPACILFYRNGGGKSTRENLIEHISLKPSRFFSLFKIFTISKADYKVVQQSKLMEFDWLWKVLVYGSYLDFNFLLKLKKEYSSIRQILDENENIVIGQGIMVGGGDENDASDLVGKPYINTRTDIKPHWVNPINKKWTIDTVHRVRNKELYEAPVLLITEGVKNDLRSVSAISYKDSVYKSSLTGIKGRGNDTKDLLRQVSGILNSSFFAYCNLMTFSSSGIEREQSHDEEKLNIPFSFDDEIRSKVLEIENLQLTILEDSNILNDNTSTYNLTGKLKQLDATIVNSFVKTDQENCLVRYANDIVIPLTMKHKGYEKFLRPLKIFHDQFVSYISLFVERFKNKLEGIDKKFIVEVWHTNQIVGMLFKVIPVKDYTEDILWINNENNNLELISLLLKLGSEKITDKLFVQKDIRGFEVEQDYFYIFKPNEQRLWDKAIGYLDVNEFADAILMAGRDGQ